MDFKRENFIPHDGRLTNINRSLLESKGYKLDKGYFIEPPASTEDQEFEGDTMHIVTNSEGKRVGVFYSTKLVFFPDNRTNFIL